MNQFRLDDHEFHNWTQMFLMAVVAAVVGALLTILAVRFTGLGTALVRPSQTTATIPVKVRPVSLNQYERATINAVNRVGPSVVMVTTSTLVENYRLLGPVTRNIKELGSGVVVRSDGYILTNNHVVNRLPAATERIMVVLSIGHINETYPAQIVGVDPLTDLALLKINRTNLPVADWGDSDRVQVGQMAIAIGTPLAEGLKNTVTVGVISAINRNIYASQTHKYLNMLQTDASINFGNSGGPLLDSGGRIIGINSAIAAGSQGISFAIPSNTAKTVVEQLIKRGRVSRPGLGIGYLYYTAKDAAKLERLIQRRLPASSGYFIAGIVKGSTIDRAGLVPGDVIVRINGQAAEDGNVLPKLTTRLGAKLTLEYYHGQLLKETVVQVEEVGQ